MAFLFYVMPYFYSFLKTPRKSATSNYLSLINFSNIFRLLNVQLLGSDMMEKYVSFILTYKMKGAIQK